MHTTKPVSHQLRLLTAERVYMRMSHKQNLNSFTNKNPPGVKASRRRSAMLEPKRLEECIPRTLELGAQQSPIPTNVVD